MPTAPVVVAMRAGLTVVNVALVTACVAVLWPQETEAVQAQPDPSLLYAPTAWAPPVWFPADATDNLWVLPDLDTAPVHAKGPRTRAASVIVADLDRGEVLYEKRADTLRPVASLTKLVSSLALASTGADLDQELCVSKAEWPSRPGARSRFETGVCHEGHEWLGAALVASDNRGAMGLASLSGLEYEQFLGRMREVSHDLGMLGDTWSDPSGLEDDNMATARDMLKAVVAVANHPDLAPAASAPQWEIERRKGPQVLGSTNRLVKRYETLAAKTGYTDTARYCFSTVVRTRSGRTLAVSVLGAPSSSWRFRDAQSLIRWAEEQS